MRVLAGSVQVDKQVDHPMIFDELFTALQLPHIMGLGFFFFFILLSISFIYCCQDVKRFSRNPTKEMLVEKKSYSSFNTEKEKQFIKINQYSDSVFSHQISFQSA